MGFRSKEQIITGVRVIGLLLILEAGFMSLSLIPALYYKQGDFFALLISALITLSAGLLCRVKRVEKQLSIDKRLGISIVALIWLLIGFFGSLPYLIGGYIPNIADAVFETTSGLTTTGATILSDVESLPKGILFWRSLTHWIGGVGIVVIVVSFVPFIGGGGMALFSAESAGPSKTKISPHIATTGKIICGIYAVLTLVCCIVYWICGMGFFDAVCHAFSTLASGGFSTKNTSAAGFSPLIQYMMILFMVPAGINFLLIYRLLKGQFSALKNNDEFKAYMFGILFSCVLIFLFTYNSSADFELTLRNALFQTVSFITSTGFVSADYTSWAMPAIWVILVLMFSGAMSGSTTGGLKLVRVILLFKNAKSITKRGVHSQAFIPIKMDGRIVQDSVINNVMAIFLMFILLLILVSFSLVCMGIGIEEAIGAGISCVFNMGPGLRESGGFGCFAHFPDAAKLVLSLAMYLGRLEIATVLVLFMPSFWKK
ncbi:MAG: TrkH family potassium uptake protein [Bacteroidales bacterium]|nr:TrkH family potassium uptake protein [Bacteroidales bacterium]